MARFKDDNSSASSTEGKSQRWEPLDLENIQNITVVTDDLEEGSNFNIEVEGEELEPQEPVRKEPESKDLLTDDVEDHSDRVPQGRAQKRIIDLARKNKEKDQELQRMREELFKVQQERETHRTTEVDARKESTKALLGSYQKELETAVLNGDVKTQAELTGKLTKANVELMALETFKPQPKLEQPLVQGPSNPREAVLQKLPESGREWAMKNKWFVTNPELTRQAVGIASEVESEGFDADDPEYYTEIDKRLAEMYPQRFNKKPEAKAEIEEPVKPKQSPVAQSSRTTPTQKAGTVRLTREEVALAKKWRIPLERFASEKKKLEQAEKSGNRTTTIFE